jgi:probable F420-dependent oxidoreductase
VVGAGADNDAAAAPGVGFRTLTFPVRFGLTTPIVTLAPRSHAPWETDAGPAEIARIAIIADRLGYHHLTCSEHVGIPEAITAQRGARYYDPLATLAYCAALTTTIRLVTHVLVLPYHHPLAVAKRYGTLDRLSAGRLVLGVGVGSLREEFALLGVDFETRGPRFEDALRALRVALGAPAPTYRGTHFDFGSFVIDPPAEQARVPIWIGSRSARSLRRALVFGDGWDPFGLDLLGLGRLLERARGSPAWAARRTPFAVVLSPERVLDPCDREERIALTDMVETYERIGATVLSLRFRHRSLAHYLDQLDAFAREVAPSFPEPGPLPDAPTKG